MIPRDMIPRDMAVLADAPVAPLRPRLCGFSSASSFAGRRIVAAKRPRRSGRSDAVSFACFGDRADWLNKIASAACLGDGAATGRSILATHGEAGFRQARASARFALQRRRGEFVAFAPRDVFGRASPGRLRSGPTSGPLTFARRAPSAGALSFPSLIGARIGVRPSARASFGVAPAAAIDLHLAATSAETSINVSSSSSGAPNARPTE
jgi:hypothetical protein